MSCINFDTGGPCSTADLTSYNIVDPPAFYASQASIEVLAVVIALVLAYVSYGVLKALKPGASDRERTRARKLVKGGIAAVLAGILLFFAYNFFVYNMSTYQGFNGNGWPGSDIFLSDTCWGCG